MEPVARSRSLAYRQVSALVGAVIAAAGGVILAGWWLRIPVLVQVAPGMTPVVPNTALGFVACGTGLCLLAFDRRVAAGACGVLSLAVGLHACLDYLFGILPALYSVLADPFITDRTPVPGRLAPETGLAFILSGGALLVLTFPPRRGGLLTAAILTVDFGALGWVALVGHATALDDTATLGPASPMALQTGALFLLMALGMICAVWSHRTGRGKGPRHWGPTVTSWICLLLTLLLALQMRFSDARLRASEFRREVGARLDALQELEDDSQRLLRSVVAFYGASQYVDRDEFDLFGSRILADHPWVLALDWMPRVKEEERAAFEERCRKEVDPGFRILELGPDDRLLPAAARAAWYPVTYSVAAPPLRKIVGLDRSAEPDVRKAITTAIATGQGCALARSRLFRDPRASPGLILIAPVYRNGAPAGTEAERVEAVHGVTVATIPWPDLVAVEFGSLPSLHIDLWVEGPTLGRGNTVFWSSSPEVEVQTPLRPALGHSQELHIGGLNLTVTAVAAPTHPAAIPSWHSWMVIVGGMLLGWLLTLYLVERNVRAERVANLVDERTEDLQRANWALLQENEERQKAVEAARAAMKSREAFLANVSHEIRTPMYAVVGIAEALLDAGLSPPQQERVRLILRSAESLLGMLNDLLDLSKAEAGRMSLDPVEFDPREAARDALETVRPRAEKKGLQVLLSVAPEVPERLRGDALRLRQVLLNLLSNAVKFTGRGRVELGLEAAGAQGDRVGLRFRVVDSGIGIPADRIGQLFQPFVQADASTTRKYGGTGLGLAICARWWS